MALWARRGERLDGLIHHCDRGVQYVAIRYTERLEAAGVTTSVGSRGDSYDNALAESFKGLYKAELIHRRAWTGLNDVEDETLSMSIGSTTDVCTERSAWAHRQSSRPPTTISHSRSRWLGLNKPSLYKTRAVQYRPPPTACRLFLPAA